MKRVFSSTLFILLFALLFSASVSAENINLTSGVAVKGGMDTIETIDTYQFTTTKDGEVYIVLDEKTSGFRMEIYDEQDKYVWGDSVGDKDALLKFDSTLRKGTYTIEVESYNWSKVAKPSYRIKATFPGAFTRNNSTFEPNETIETSLPIQTGQYYKSTSDTIQDRDVYQFTTNKVGEVYLALDERNTDFGVEIYDEQGKYVWGDSISRTAASGLLMERELSKGTYYIEVTPSNFTGITSATYRLRTVFPSTFTRNYSTFEPNETFETSMPIRRGQYYQSKGEAIHDVDTYHFTTNKEGNVTISIEGRNTDFGVEIYDEQGKYVWGDSISRTATNGLVFNDILGKGTYYVKISGIDFTGITNSTYRLKANFSANTDIFTDLRTDQEWSENLLWAIDKKLIGGYKNVLNKKTGKKENWLKPYDKLTESQFLTVLFRHGDAVELSKVKSVYQLASKYNLPTKSTLNNQAFANKPITRGKMAEILVSKHLGKRVSEEEAIEFFIENNLTTAKTVSAYKPNDSLARAHIAAFIRKYDALLNKK